jgi:hypothetical protein
MTIISTTQDARAATLASERQAAFAIHRLHQHAVVEVKGGIARFTHAMQTAASGNDGTVPQSFAHGAHEEVTKPIRIAIQHFGNSARVVIHNESDAAAKRGEIMAHKQLQATVPKGYTYSFALAHPSPKQTARQAAVYSLFDKYGDEAATAATDAIRQGVLAGRNPNAIARSLMDALDISLVSALNTSRTEAMRSLRDATLANYQANSDVVDSWVWLASGDACAMCLAMSGQEFPLDEDMDSHNNCRCAMVPKTKSWADIFAGTGIDASDIEETQADIPSGIDMFNAMSADAQRDLLGPAKYNAWKAGAFDLSDLVGTSSDGKWGTSRYEKSLKDLGLDASDYADDE